MGDKHLYHLSWVSDGFDNYSHDKLCKKEDPNKAKKKGKKLNFQWGDDDGFARKNEEAREIKLKDIRRFNVEFKKQEEYKKMQAQKREAKLAEKLAKQQVKAPPLVLSRGKFKRGEERPAPPQQEHPQKKQKKNKKNKNKN